MNSANRILIVLLLAIGMVAAYWFLLLNPKKAEIAEVDNQIEQVQSSVAQSEQAIAAGEQAKASFSTDYAQLVTLGKAVPAGDEQAALLVQLNRIGMRNDSVFSSIVLEGSGAPAPAADGSESEGAAPGSEPSTTEPPAEDPAAAPPPAAVPAATATESSVASLPIGATVGEAGFATLPYKLVYSGDFFKLADFIADLDGLVSIADGGEIAVDGRLMTIDGFALSPEGGEDLTKLSGNFSITTFASPATEGALAGAGPAGPTGVSPVTTGVESP